MEVRDGSFFVDCSDCTGPKDLGDLRCFKGISNRMIPGFTGPIVLRGTIEKRYTGPLVDALVSFSEIASRIEVMIPPEDRSRMHFTGRRRAGKFEKHLRESLWDDPDILVNNEANLVKEMRKIVPDRDSVCHENLRNLIESTRRMVARMDE